MDPLSSIEHHAEEVLRQFGPRTKTICHDVNKYRQSHINGTCSEAEELLKMLSGLCEICEETNTALTEHVLVDFDPNQDKTESTLDNRPMSTSIKKIVRWVNNHHGILVGASIFAIGTLFIVINRR